MRSTMLHRTTEHAGADVLGEGAELLVQAVLVHASPTLTAQRISAGSRPTSAQWRCSTSRLAVNVWGSTNGTFQPSA